MDNQMLMCKRLRELREELGKTQHEMSKILGVARSNISKYENGELDPNTDILSKYADNFDCTVDYILGRTNNRKEEVKKSDEYTAVVVHAKDAKIPADVLHNYIQFLKNQIGK